MPAGTNPRFYSNTFAHSTADATERWKVPLYPKGVNKKNPILLT